jgi:putative FmdB family regulatory protein
MPNYAYLCEACGSFEEFCQMADFEKPAPCPTCRRPAPRMVAAAQLSLMTGDNRTAHKLNEKNASEPRIGRVQQKSHYHEHSHKHAHGLTKPGHGQHSHVSDRPWMVGH